MEDKLNSNAGELTSIKDSRESDDFYRMEFEHLNESFISKCNELESLKNQLADEGKLNQKLIISNHQQLKVQVDEMLSELGEKNSEIDHLNHLVSEAEDVLIEKEKEISWLSESILEMKQRFEVKCKYKYKSKCER